MQRLSCCTVVGVALNRPAVSQPFVSRVTLANVVIVGMGQRGHHPVRPPRSPRREAHLIRCAAPYSGAQ